MKDITFTEALRESCPFCGSKDFKISEYNKEEDDSICICDNCEYAFPHYISKWESSLTRIGIIMGAFLGSLITVCIMMIIEKY